MTFALSTNWCNRRLVTGEEIADLAQDLGFDELELGFHTSLEQVRGFKARLDRMPVGSIHAFCPVPISAPCGYPELYLLAGDDAEGRRMAALQVRRNIQFAAEMGADTVVLHAGRVSASAWFARNRVRNRRRRGRARLDVLRQVLDGLLPDLERCRVTLALENLPYLEGFPDEAESAELVSSLAGAPVRAWFDTGHHQVRVARGWATPLPDGRTWPEAALFRGMHLNDVKSDEDDHLAPGDGCVDFAALGPFARAVAHRVFEPNAAVPPDRLKAALADLRRLWG